MARMMPAKRKAQRKMENAAVDFKAVDPEMASTLNEVQTDASERLDWGKGMRNPGKMTGVKGGSSSSVRRAFPIDQAIAGVGKLFKRKKKQG